MENEVAIIVRILLAAVLGLIIGIQREKRKKIDRNYGTAGLRNHSLVCLGASLITSLGILMFPQDPARLAASIMTGIGFIGAGTIMATQGKIRGITNASSIWVVAAIGIAAGMAMFKVAIFATMLTFLILELKRFEEVD